MWKFKEPRELGAMRVGFLGHGPRAAHNLERAALKRNVSLANPIAMESNSGKRFYAILHRIDGGIVLDLEPVRLGEETGDMAARAASRLQGLPGRDIGLLCDVVAEEVRELTGYDRVMVYKFHEDDDHGEIVAESRRSDLEPYLGRHYPAAHISPASRFLFLMNRVRMICDCRATPVGVVEAEDLNRPLCFVGSTLKAHNGLFMASMDSIASLALAVVVNGSGNDGQSGVKLWGLVVCHHTSPRVAPFPLRSACEFLMRTFGLQIDVEMQLAAIQTRQ